jgi:zinc transport system substrate-binding protein
VVASTARDLIDNDYHPLQNVVMPLRLLAALGAAALALTACSSSSDTPADPAGEPVTVMAAFYPLQYAAEEVGGSDVTVTGLTPPGAEPHDVELTPQQIAEVSEADLILYIKGFQPAVDEAVAQVAPDKAVDVSQGITLLKGEEDSHEGEAVGADHGGEASATDPHIWLDPLNMVTIADTITARLGEIRPDSSTVFAANAANLDQQLTALDEKWSSQTETCSSRDLVVSHEAFGYLAERYNFTQLGISGLSPEVEPSPAKVAEVTDFVTKNDVKTIYFETLVDPKVAETVAAETGAATAVLDPLEGLPEGSDQTYLTVMESNLAAVVAGQPCP